MEILYKWTSRRIEKAAYRVMKIIPKEDGERILSLLGKFFYVANVPDEPEIPDGCVAQTVILENDKYAIVFFVSRLWDTSKAELLSVVAHEFAHVFLVHCRDDGQSHEQAEEAVHKQLEAWGIEEG